MVTNKRKMTDKYIEKLLYGNGVGLPITLVSPTPHMSREEIIFRASGARPGVPATAGRHGDQP